VDDNASLRSYIKRMPVVGPAAKLANRARLFLMDALRQADRQWKSALLRMRHRASWDLLKNPWSRKRFVSHQRALTPAEGTFIGDLTAKGVASGSVEQVGIDGNDYGRLRKRVDEFAGLAADRVAAASASYSDALDLASLEHNRERFQRFFRDRDQAKLDDYILKMNPENSVMRADDPLIRVGLSAPVLHVVSGYMKLWPKLIYADAWYSIPLDVGKRIGSQQWHRDPEDRQMVKVYLYFSDIDADAGAMEYMLGTSNAGGRPGLEIGHWMAAGANLYPSPELVEKSFPATQRYSCSGPVGTLLFCDTTGLHRGGISRAKPRVVATWTFVTPASRYQRRFTVRPVDGVTLSEEGRFAVDE
jgi:hypothetical protein